ncbi:transketolase family protein [Caballeronia mineralivorans]|jgi:transketolase|uniref:transketolase family protein n=1 Tax=Caballeronia mineralivorans TaxID=2010198 RepID=UPI0023F43217|nr:transketolase C-terminal domain-containing protein [Caballeronia mineralivorans]MDB5782613.1 transketolase [Caballeronia mineralivorans]MEA3098247.1 transketolase [Caballeronia mineralivorans]
MREYGDLRDGAVGAIGRLTEAGQDIIVMVADSTSTSKIGAFMKAYPDRVVNVGIAEQNMVGMAAGLALGGHTVFTANAAPFLVGRANEQVKNDICYSATNVKMLGLNAGVAYGPLASTHHAIDDISVMSGFGTVQIFAPCDEVETEQVIEYAASIDGPVYIRLDNAKFPIVHDAHYRFKPGRPDVLIEGKGVVVIALGSVVGEALEACESLKSADGIEPTLVNLSSLRPLDHDALAAIIERHDAVVTVEEHSLHGGIGATVAVLLARRRLSKSLNMLGISEGEFAHYGTRRGIRQHYGIDAAGIAQTVRSINTK